MTDAATREKRENSTIRVLRYMAAGTWCTNVALTQPQVGGNRGVARLWEAERAFGLQIERRKVGVDRHEYRWCDPHRLAEVLAVMRGEVVKVKQTEMAL